MLSDHEFRPSFSFVLFFFGIRSVLLPKPYEGITLPKNEEDQKSKEHVGFYRQIGAFQVIDCEPGSTVMSASIS